MLICRKRASRCPIFLLGRMPSSHSTFSSNAISVPGNRQTATCGSPIAAKPRVIELLNLVVTSLSSIWAGRVATLCKLEALALQVWALARYWSGGGPDSDTKRVAGVTFRADRPPARRRGKPLKDARPQCCPSATQPVAARPATPAALAPARADACRHRVQDAPRTDPPECVPDHPP